MTRFQEQVVSLMQGGTPASRAKRAPWNGKSPAASPDAALKATGSILSGYLAKASGRKIDQVQLVALASSLRAALS